MGINKAIYRIGKTMHITAVLHISTEFEKYIKYSDDPHIIYRYTMPDY